MREWAKQSIELLGSISCTDYDDLKDVIRWIMQLVEFDLLNCQSLENVNVLPQHLFMRNDAKEHWTSIFSLLTKFESRTIRLQLLSRDNHNQFITTILTAIDQENCQDYGMFVIPMYYDITRSVAIIPLPTRTALYKLFLVELILKPWAN